MLYNSALKLYKRKVIILKPVKKASYLKLKAIFSFSGGNTIYDQ